MSKHEESFACRQKERMDFVRYRVVIALHCFFFSNSAPVCAVVVWLIHFDSFLSSKPLEHDTFCPHSRNKAATMMKQQKVMEKMMRPPQCLKPGATKNMIIIII